MRISMMVVALGVFVLGSAAVLAHTGVETDKNWWDDMRMHHAEVHGDNFEQHHQDMHGEDWMAHVEECHSSVKDAPNQTYGMMGYTMM
jgi:hypothetical protein